MYRQIIFIYFSSHKNLRGLFDSILLHIGSLNTILRCKINFFWNLHSNTVILKSIVSKNNYNNYTQYQILEYFEIINDRGHCFFIIYRKKEKKKYHFYFHKLPKNNIFVVISKTGNLI